MAVTVAQLAALVDGELVGDGEVAISGVNSLELAGPAELSFLTSARQRHKLSACRAAALVVPQKLAAGELEEMAQRPLLRVADPNLATARIQQFLLSRPFVARGVHPSAVIGAACRIPPEVSIGPGAVLGEGVRLGERVTIAAGVMIGDEVSIGDDSRLDPRVTVYSRSVIGRRVIIQAGSVIGSDGFGYATDQQGNHHKRPHQGKVRLGDEVEVGANVCIDRGTFGDTVIGAGTKIDNLVQIAHNVEVGENCLLVAQVGIAGSCQLGRRVVMGGQSALAGHITMGEGVMIAGQSGVHNDQPPGAVVAGYPAIDHRQWLRVSAAVAKLPAMIKELRGLRRQVEQLTAGPAGTDGEETQDDGR
ncbi:MAG: UDP-3-O-(3-hydroxymyristoyl)glucosamine N-acyltransferase [Desulfurivibrio sp.]|nr:UDP-3-O-(3-hydroxymyristoyl)glucosamine N-acyltransferase [Desulfurivibrio sp.]